MGERSCCGYVFRLRPCPLCFTKKDCFSSEAGQHRSPALLIFFRAVCMFGIGSTEFVVILLVALLVLGPKSLSKVTRTVAKYMGEFRRVSTEFQRTLNAEVAEDDRRQAAEEAKKKADAVRAARARQSAAAQPAPTAAPQPAAQTSVHPQTAAAPQAGPEPSQPAKPVTPEVLSTASAEPQPAPAGSPLEAALRRTAAEAGTLPSEEKPRGEKA